MKASAVGGHTMTGRATSASTVVNGHKPTVFAAFLHFDLSFMIWVLLGALGVSISEGLGLNPAQKGLMVAIPIPRRSRRGPDNEPGNPDARSARRPRNPIAIMLSTKDQVNAAA